MPQLNIKQALFAFVTGLTDVAALIGQRMYPVKKPQGDIYPQVTYYQTHEHQLWNMEGPNGSSDYFFSLHCWGTTQDSADLVARTIKGRGTGFSPTRLNGFKGWLGGPPGTGVFVQTVEVRDLYDDEDHLHNNRPQQDDDVGVFRVFLSVYLFADEF